MDTNEPESQKVNSCKVYNGHTEHTFNKKDFSLFSGQFSASKQFVPNKILHTESCFIAQRQKNLQKHGAHEHIAFPFG